VPTLTGSTEMEHFVFTITLKMLSSPSPSGRGFTICWIIAFMKHIAFALEYIEKLYILEAALCDCHDTITSLATSLRCCDELVFPK
jgi:hypothetical protein